MVVHFGDFAVDLGSRQLLRGREEIHLTLCNRSRSDDSNHSCMPAVLMLTGRLDEAEREVRLAEKAGVPVNPRLKDEIRKRRLAR